jgi:hypothetical protein
MTLERKKRIALSSCILCGMLVCAFFSRRHAPHHAAFGEAFYALGLINSWMLYRWNLNRPQPDNLIHLFPVLAEASKERP